MGSADEGDSRHLTPHSRYLCDYVIAWAPYGLQDHLQIFVEFGIRREQLIDRARRLVRNHHRRGHLNPEDETLILQLHNALHVLSARCTGVTKPAG